MTENGKRARLDEHKHKNEFAQIDKETEMSGKEDFSCEIVTDAAGELENETIPEDAIGCYVPIGRPNLGQRFATLEDELKKLKKLMTRLHFKNFKNQVSQFGRGIEAAVVLKKFPFAIKTLGDVNITFDKVFKSKNISLSEKEDFRKFHLFKKVNEITGPGTIFRDVVTSRNAEALPEQIDVLEIEETRNAIESDECLRTFEKEMLEKATASFQKLMQLEEIEDLVREFNNK